MERVRGIKPRSSAWKAVALSLSYTRIKWRKAESTILTPLGAIGLANHDRSYLLDFPLNWGLWEDLNPHTAV